MERIRTRNRELEKIGTKLSPSVRAVVHIAVTLCVHDYALCRDSVSCWLNDVCLSVTLSRCLDPGENFADVLFCVHGEVFRAHRVILSARCKYFYQMFTGRWRGRERINLNHPLVRRSQSSAMTHCCHDSREGERYDPLLSWQRRGWEIWPTVVMTAERVREDWTKASICDTFSISVLSEVCCFHVVCLCNSVPVTSCRDRSWVCLLISIVFLYRWQLLRSEHFYSTFILVSRNHVSSPRHGLRAPTRKRKTLSVWSTSWTNYTIVQLYIIVR